MGAILLYKGYNYIKEKFTLNTQSHSSSRGLSRTIGDEKRIDADGKAYTKEEFLEEYPKDGEKKWEEAKRQKMKIDPADNKPYTKKEFLEKYPEEGKKKWKTAEKAEPEKEPKKKPK